MTRARGFTLVELLVALALFAIVSAFAYRGLTSLLEARESLDREARLWRDVALLVGRVERDVRATLDRRATGPSGTTLAPVSSLVDLGGTTARGLAITRSGAPLHANPLAAPQRIAYRLDGSRIERLSWPAPDAAPRALPEPVPVFDGAKALAFRFLDAQGAWRDDWGLPGSNERLPAAVEMTLELATGDKIVRLVDVTR